MSYPAIYRARAAANGGTLDVFVPQIFGDVPIKVTESVGGQVSGMGWVMFQGGDAAHPVWFPDVGLGTGGGGGTDEVWVGPDEPGSTIELWYDSDAVSDTVISVWTNVTFQNGWVNYGGVGNQPVQYRKFFDLVQIRGAMKDGTNSSTAFTLPVGYRPPANASGTLVGPGVNVEGVADILSDGSVNIYATAIGLVRFPMVQFSVTP